jgi:hypothetical protein
MSIDVTADRGALVLTGSATELAALARELAAVVDPRAAEIAVPTTATPERVLQLLRTQRLRLARLRGRDGKVVAQILGNNERGSMTLHGSWKTLEPISRSAKDLVTFVAAPKKHARKCAIDDESRLAVDAWWVKSQIVGASKDGCSKEYVVTVPHHTPGSLVQRYLGRFADAALGSVRSPGAACSMTPRDVCLEFTRRAQIVGALGTTMRIALDSCPKSGFGCAAGSLAGQLEALSTAATAQLVSGRSLNRARASAAAGSRAASAQICYGDITDGLCQAVWDAVTDQDDAVWDSATCTAPAVRPSCEAGENAADTAIPQLPTEQEVNEQVTAMQTHAEGLIASLDVLSVLGVPDPGAEVSPGPSDPTALGYASPDELEILNQGPSRDLIVFAETLASVLPAASYEHSAGTWRTWYEDVIGIDVAALTVAVDHYFGGGCVHNPVLNWDLHQYDNRFSTWYLVSDRYLDFKDCTGTKFFSDTVDENYDFGNDYFRTWTRHDSNLRGDPYGWLWSHNDGSKGGEQSFLLHYNQRLLRSAPYSNCQGDAC